MGHLASLDHLKCLGWANGQLFQALMELGFHVIWKAQSVNMVDQLQNSMAGPAGDSFDFSTPGGSLGPQDFLASSDARQLNGSVLPWSQELSIGCSWLSKQIVQGWCCNVQLAKTANGMMCFGLLARKDRMYRQNVHVAYEATCVS